MQIRIFLKNEANLGMVNISPIQTMQTRQQGWKFHHLYIIYRHNRIVVVKLELFYHSSLLDNNEIQCIIARFTVTSS